MAGDHILLHIAIILVFSKLIASLSSTRDMLLKEREAKRDEELKARKIDFLIKETMAAGGFKPKK